MPESSWKYVATLPSSMALCLLAVDALTVNDALKWATIEEVQALTGVKSTQKYLRDLARLGRIDQEPYLDTSGSNPRARYHYRPFLKEDPSDGN